MKLLIEAAVAARDRALLFRRSAERVDEVWDNPSFWPSCPQQAAYEILFASNDWPSPRGVGLALGEPDALSAPGRPGAPNAGHDADLRFSLAVEVDVIDRLKAELYFLPDRDDWASDADLADAIAANLQAQGEPTEATGLAIRSVTARPARAAAAA